MRITVEVTQAELEEMSMTESDIKESIIEDMDYRKHPDTFEYVGYNIYIKVVEEEVI